MSGEFCFLIWRDTSGRGEKGMLRFDSAEARETYARETLLSHLQDHSEDWSELDSAIQVLDNGGIYHDDYENTEYEYI